MPVRRRQAAAAMLGFVAAIALVTVSFSRDLSRSPSVSSSSHDGIYNQYNGTLHTGPGGQYTEQSRCTWHGSKKLGCEPVERTSSLEGMHEPTLLRLRIIAALALLQAGLLVACGMLTLRGRLRTAPARIAIVNLLSLIGAGLATRLFWEYGDTPGAATYVLAIAGIVGVMSLVLQSRRE